MVCTIVMVMVCWAIFQFILSGNKGKVSNIDKEKLLLFEFRIISHTTFPWCHCARSRNVNDCAQSWQRTTIRRIFQTSHFERNNSGWWGWAEFYFSFRVTFNSCSAQFVRFIGWFSNSFVVTSPS